MADALTQLQRDVAVLQGNPLPEPEPCLRRACRGLTIGPPAKLCERCNRTWTVETVRLENVGQRLLYPPGTWPSLDRFGEPLEVLESLSDPALRNLARIKRIPTPMAPERKAELESGYRRDEQYRAVLQEQRTIETLQKRQAEMAARLAELGAQ